MSENPYLAQLGRISGKLLTANLERNGVDLTFRAGATDSDLLYLDVNNMRVGIKSNPPTTDLEITGYSRVSNDVLVTGTDAIIDNVVIGTNGIFSSVVGPINIVPTGADAYVQYARVLTTDFELETNYLQVTTTNQNLELDAAGTGKIDIQNSTDILGNLEVNGNIAATGDIQLNGQFFIGDSPLDTVTVNPDFQQGLVSNSTDTYDLGSPLKRWSQVWIAGIITDQLATTTLEISGQTAASGNTITTIQSNEDLLINSYTNKTPIENLLFDSSNELTVIDAVGTFSAWWIDTNIPWPPPPYIYEIVGWTAKTPIGDRTVTGISQGYLAEYPPGNFFITTRIDLNFTNSSSIGSSIRIVNETGISVSRITNAHPTNNLVISHTGNGYLRIADTNALRIPAGDNSQRVGVETGETRWNNQEGYLECFDGTVWQIATGGGVVVTPAFMEELSRRYTLIFG